MMGTPPSSLPWITPMTRTRRPPGSPNRSATIGRPSTDVPSTTVSAVRSSVAAGVPGGSVDVVVVVLVVVVVVLVVVLSGGGSVDELAVTVLEEGALSAGTNNGSPSVAAGSAPGTGSVAPATDPPSPELQAAVAASAKAIAGVQIDRWARRTRS